MFTPRPLSAFPTVSDGDVHIEVVGLEALPIIKRLNRQCFDEERVINRFDREDLLLMLAYVGGEAIGFKIGYRENATTFYSAKGGVLESHRRSGVARLLLHAMMDRCRRHGYEIFAYDTFPNRHPGMAILGLSEGFRVTAADYNQTMGDWRLRLEIAL